MKVEVISDRQSISMVVLYILGSTVVLGTAAEAGRDLWISIAIAVAATIPLALVFARLLALFPGKNIMEIAHLVFGNIVGKILCVLITWFAFHLGSLVLVNFGMYMKVVALPETPQIAPSLILSVLCIWAVREGIEVLGRLAKFGIIFTVLLAVMTILLMIPQWDENKISPILANGLAPVLQGAFSTFSFPMAEIVVFTAVLSPTKKRCAYKTFLYGLLIGGLIILLTSFNEMMVLGVDLYSMSYFPAHSAISRVNIGDFVQRLEIIPAVGFLISGLIKISVCLLAASKGIARLLNFDDYRFIALPVGLMMANFSELLFPNIIKMMEFATKTWRYYAFPFEVLIPVGILIAAEVKVRMDRKYQSQNE